MCGALTAAIDLGICVSAMAKYPEEYPRLAVDDGYRTRDGPSGV